MRSVFYLFIIGALLWDCSKSEDLSHQHFDQRILWKMGAGHTSDTVIILETSSKPEAEVEVLSYSLCPNIQVRLSIIDDLGAVVFESMSDTLHRASVNIPVDVELTLHTELIPAETGVQCVWMGQVEMAFRYDQ